MERRLAAIVAADVVGFTRLMESDEAGTIADLRSHQQELINPTVDQYKGRVVKLMGDGVLVEFASVVDAVNCAIAIQTGMVERQADTADERRMLFRIGVNLGEIVFEDDDIYGNGVNLTSRLETLAEPGGICISGTVHEHVAGKIRHVMEYMGARSLKNIEDPVAVYHIRLDGADTIETIHVHQRSDPESREHMPRERPSIALLPFKNLSGDPDLDYLGEGLRLGILSSLVQLSGLFLIGTNAVNCYRGADVPPAQAGREVGVSYVLDGAVQRAGDRVRATLQLIEVQTGKIIWAERYDRVLDDLFRMQDEITHEVIISLDVKLLGREKDKIWFSRLSNSDARDYFLRGISHFYTFSSKDNEAARQMFTDLCRVEPEIAVGPSMVSLTHWLDAMSGWSDDSPRSFEQAREWAEKAVQYDDDNGLGHAVLGHLLLQEGRHGEALESANIAAEIRSSCPLAYGLLANVQTYCGEPQPAVNNAKHALDLEGVYPSWLINVLAAAYRDSGKVELSIPAAHESVRLDPGQTDARIILCSDYQLQSHDEEAQRVAAEILEVEPAFRLSQYSENLPYRNNATPSALVEDLRAAGLPD